MAVKTAAVEARMADASQLLGKGFIWQDEQLLEQSLFVLFLVHAFLLPR
jgi:hypothetical protein